MLPLTLIPILETLAKTTLNLEFGFNTLALVLTVSVFEFYFGLGNGEYTLIHTKCLKG
ncbi:hypothetical protein PL9214291376 [Planktothrix tepida PCC 9214]|uniref:Uncharacterized protein n=1 Tax=Planktothrix tepida PCC 9214 TaxID=671072 RepID=A0A1J1LGW6_9CYAN|nr:hypothetical protein PL9214291376 [Planktothrix tepida PCC 9214]